jgi:predicted AAA+ superfamily ATPase
MPYVNFENASTLRQAKEDPAHFIARFPDGLIIDEAHHFPEIFSLIQVTVDEDKFRGQTHRKFIVTGSSNFSLLEKVTQSMAGRTAILTLLPLALSELDEQQRNYPAERLILNGGYPAVWTDEEARHLLQESYYNTYVERDIKQIVNVRDMLAFHKFIRLCAGRIGSEFNASALSGEIGVTLPTINHWLSVLAASYIAYLLPPFYANINKRLLKTPKLYFYDTSLAAYLLGITNEEQLKTHPLRGALFENMIVNEFMKEATNRGTVPTLYFYRDRSGREVDIVRTRAQYLEAYEVKSSMSYNSTFTANLRYLHSLLPEQLVRSAVIYDGESFADKPMEGAYNFRDISRYIH